MEESLKDPLQHYDASQDNRAKGAGFYQFSADEETRRKQMEELNAARTETVEERQARGADAPTPSDEKASSRAGEKRRRELEDRRKLIESKRKKVKQDSAAPDDASTSVSGHSYQYVFVLVGTLSVSHPEILRGLFVLASMIKPLGAAVDALQL